MLPGMVARVISTAGLGGGGITASASPASVERVLASSTGPKVVTSPPTTVTVANGSGSYTYAWAQSTPGVVMEPTNPAAATTSFSAEYDPGGGEIVRWTCTVTDTNGATALATVDVTLQLIDTSNLWNQ